jgi:hypothetical protein
MRETLRDPSDKDGLTRLHTRLDRGGPGHPRAEWLRPRAVRATRGRGPLLLRRHRVGRVQRLAPHDPQDRNGPRHEAERSFRRASLDAYASRACRLQKGPQPLSCALLRFRVPGAAGNRRERPTKSLRFSRLTPTFAARSKVLNLRLFIGETGVGERRAGRLGRAWAVSWAVRLWLAPDHAVTRPRSSLALPGA